MLGVQTRWVEHQTMIVDSLTKVGAHPNVLYKLMGTGKYRIVAECDLLEESVQLKAAGKAKRR